MNRLTTERLEKFVSDIKTDGMCDITDSQVESALIRLFAYEQAAKNKVALPEALKYAEIYGRAFICVDRNGSVHAVDPSQITITILNEPANAQPVMPVRREPISFDALMAAASEVTGAKSEFDATPEKCYQAVPFMNFNSLSRIVEMFRTAQPVSEPSNSPVIPDAYVLDELGRMTLNGVCEPRVSFGSGWNACRAEMLKAQAVSEPYKLPDVLDFDCEFENGDYDIDEEPWLRGRVDGFNEALQVIKRSLNTKHKPTAQESE